jgi:hypothetical protein
MLISHLVHDIATSVLRIERHLAAVDKVQSLPNGTGHPPLPPGIAPFHHEGEDELESGEEMETAFVEDEPIGGG